MAEIGQRQGRRRPQYVGKTVQALINRGKAIAKGWPRTRPKQKSIKGDITLLFLKFLRLGSLFSSVNEKEALRAAIFRFKQRHTGIQGSSIVRQRDIETTIQAGRMWALRAPDGTTYWPGAVVFDVSDILDHLEPEVGSLITRNDDTWMPVLACEPGKVLMVAPSLEGLPGCCPPAQEARPGREVDSTP